MKTKRKLICKMKGEGIIYFFEFMLDGWVDPLKMLDLLL